MSTKEAVRKQEIEILEKELKSLVERSNQRWAAAMWNMEVCSSDPYETARISELRWRINTLKASAPKE